VTLARIDRNTRQDIAEVLVRYATGIDRRDWTLFRTCFTEDCHADYGDIGVFDGVDAITGFMQDSHAKCGHTLHRITNQAITQKAGAVVARSYVDAIILAADNRSGMHAIGYYDDELVHTDDGWRIAHRRYTMVRLSPIARS
jgi:3-phenylpropionate/cinnamic acid dioxygenase small subunit